MAPSLPDLPPEILLQIYHDILPSRGPIILGKQPVPESTVPFPLLDQEPAHDALSMLFVCRELHGILAPLFFSQQVFQIHVEATSSTWNRKHRSFQDRFLEAHGGKLRNVMIHISLCTGGMCSNFTWLHANGQQFSVNGGAYEQYYMNRSSTEGTLATCQRELRRVVQLLRQGRRWKISSFQVRVDIAQEFRDRSGMQRRLSEEADGIDHLLGGLRRLKGMVSCVEEEMDEGEEGESEEGDYSQFLEKMVKEKIFL